MLTQPTMRFVAIFSTLGLLLACTPWVFSQNKPAKELDLRLSTIVYEQQAAWNRGDLDAFMSAYWKSEQLTFSAGGSVARGWDSTLQRYRNRYPTPVEMGKLTFSDLEVQELSEHSALMLGNWHLEKDKPASGNFSLVWKQIDGRWVIIHDHSSSKE